MPNSRVRHTYDAALALRAPGSAPVTASGTTNAVDIYEITNSPYGNLTGANGIGTFDLVVYVGALDGSGNGTYTLNIQSVNEAGQATTQETVTLTPNQVGKVLVFGLTPETLADFAGDAAKVQIAYPLGGTTPTLNFWAFLAPAQHAG